MGYSSLKGLRGGDLGEGHFTGETERLGFERYANALWAGLLLIGAHLGNLEVICLAGNLREMNSTSEYLCKPGGHSGFKSE
jgi:hypothetical protein